MTFAEVIEALGGSTALAEALGRPEGTVSAWKSRDSIPPDMWAAIVEEARSQKNKAVSLTLLASIRASKRV